MSVRKPNIKDVQKRVANISIGASTLRNQGAKGVAEIARGFLWNKLDLTGLSNKTQRQFNRWLNEKTEALKQELPEGAKNWGTARKAINIFLENAFYDRLLAKEYGLEKLGAILELPLDEGVIEGLRGDSKGDSIAKWQGIKKLDRKNSKKFQKRAEKVTKSHPNYGYRIYLDLKYWRANPSSNTKKGRL